MRTFSPLPLLSALGVLSAAATSAVAAADTSQWKCESCPFEKGVSGALDVGAGLVSDSSAKGGDFTGLNTKGGFLVLGGTARLRCADGLFGSVSASDLDLDSRSLAAELGQEGLYSLRIGYAEIPHLLSDSATSPFLGVGGATLTLPPGFPAATTTAMPLAGTLQPVELGFKRKRLDAGVTWLFGQEWSTRISLRHDVRDGTQRSSGSFYASASQLVVPVDQVTDQFEASVSYASRQMQATLAYQVSLFRNGQESLTWSNPFTPIVSGASTGQLALAPDNQFHQIVGSLGYDISPKIRASGDFAFGRMTQDATFLDPTLNLDPAAGLPDRAALPAQSLRGRANTFNGSVRITANPTERLRLNASYARDLRDNRTPSESYPAVSTDMFLGAQPRSNQPFSFTQDRFKVSAEYRGPGSLKGSVGADQEYMKRTRQEVGTTRETTLWGRLAAQPRDDLSLALKLAHAQRGHSTYGIATWIDPAENPLLRKYNQADRTRDTAGLRADLTVRDNVTLGFNVDYAKDDYSRSVIGLTEARSVNVGTDLSAALNEATQVHLFAQGERIRSTQAGSQLFAQPDWYGRSKDRVDTVGLGVKHGLPNGKYEMGADFVLARSRGDVTVDGVSAAPFPTAATSLHSLKLHASYRLTDSVSLTGSFWFEQYAAQDWRLDGVLPSTVPNLLNLGEQTPHYGVSIVRVALRYRF